MEHICELPMKMRKYQEKDIYEFDSLDELRMFDTKYQNNSGSIILQEIAGQLNCREYDMSEFSPVKAPGGYVEGFMFRAFDKTWKYKYETRKIEELS